MKFRFVRRFLAIPLALFVAAVVSAAASAPRRDVVSVRATVPLATEPGDQSADFAISRIGPTNNAITILYHIAGSATNGVDYTQIPTSVTLAAGQIATNISIAPVAEPGASRYKTVVLSLRRLRTDDYFIGYPDSAKVFIVYNYTNRPPNVKIMSPTNGSVFLSLPNIAISAQAGDSNGWVTSVEFLANGSSVGTASNSTPGPSPLAQFLNKEEHNLAFPVPDWPLRSLFQIIWSNVPSGVYTLTAIATDNAGQQTTSAAVNITVSTNLPTPTTKILTPPNGAVFLVNTPINILAEAGESGGVINTVEFFGDNSSLGTVTNPSPIAGPHPSPNFLNWRPYFLRWTNAAIGSNSIYTVATDANGTQATSAVVSINVLTNFPHRHRW